MEILTRTSLKNKYVYQMLTILADILARIYNFMIKRIPRGFNIFTTKNKKLKFLFLHHILGLHLPEAIKQ